MSLIKDLFNRFVQWLGYDLGISPNQITLGRLIFFVPSWLMWIYKDDLAQLTGLSWLFFGYLAFFAVTTVIFFDIVDGALARATGQVSDQGKFLDPIVDKLITYFTLALFWSVINQIALLILFTLDVASTFLRGAHVHGANQFGKKKALSQNLSKLFFGMAVLASVQWFNAIGNFLIYTAICLAVISVGLRVLPDKIKSSVQVVIPQLLTLGNLVAGLGTIWCAFNDRIELGVFLNFTAMVFDLIDGAAARKLGVASSFGKHFDTIADLVSFGAGPAFLVGAINGFTPVAIFVCCTYFFATGIRLYDYTRSKGKTPSGFFRGLPSPAGAWLVVSSALFNHPLFCLITMITAAVLMCLFFLHWIHFNRVLPDINLFEITAAIVIGLLTAFIAPPGGFAAGPIVVYIFSPTWRKPGLTTDKNQI